jgi:aldose 1-epimerase
MFKMRMTKVLISTVLTTLLASSIAADSKVAPRPAVPVQLFANLSQTDFGKDMHGEKIELYTLKNASGMSAKVMTYGATLTELLVPDKPRKDVDIVLGFETLKPYEEQSPYFGATIGRYANRIAGAKFILDGKDYYLAPNNGHNTLHGGIRGFDKRLWKAEPANENGIPSVKFTYLSKDMEEGFPGNLTVTVTYSLTNENELKIDYTATTDKPTPINLTNHAYFNLAGAGEESVLHHQVRINADSYTPADKQLIPTGSIEAVKGTAFDFTEPKEIGHDIDQVKGGYDHNFVLRQNKGELKEAAVVVEPISGRTIVMLTTEPGVQFYTGNFLDGTIRGIGGVYPKHYAFTLEAQHFPDSVHRDNWPTTILRPGQTYKQTTVYKYSEGASHANWLHE